MKQCNPHSPLGSSAMGSGVCTVETGNETM